MAIPINVEQLIDGNVVEHARVEYKSGWNPEDIVHTICAFANDIDNWGGGYIVVGVAEEDGLPARPVEGLAPDSIDAAQKNLVQLCNRISPHYAPVCEPVEYQGARLLLIWVPGGYDRPYSAPTSLSAKRSSRSVYIRRFSSTVQAKPGEERDLSEMGGRVPFDDRVNHQFYIRSICCHAHEKPRDGRCALQRLLRPIARPLHRGVGMWPVRRLNARSSSVKCLGPTTPRQPDPSPLRGFPVDTRPVATQRFDTVGLLDITGCRQPPLVPASAQ